MNLKIGDKVSVVRGKSANEIGIIEDTDNKGYVNIRYLRNNQVRTVKASNLELLKEEEVMEEPKEKKVPTNVLMSDEDKFKHNLRMALDEQFEQHDQVTIQTPNGDSLVIVNDEPKQSEKVVEAQQGEINTNITDVEKAFVNALNELIKANDINMAIRCFEKVDAKHEQLKQIKLLFDEYKGEVI